MLKQHFLRRRYPRQKVEEAYKRALSKNREELLDNNQQKETKEADSIDKEDRIFLITTYNPGTKAPLDVIKENWPLLGTSNTTTEASESWIINGHRRCTNLRDILLRAKLPDP